MANRYWVGGTGNWDGSNTSNWSDTSGGSSGASVPTSADDVFFDANSGSGTATLASTPAYCRNLNLTGYTGTITGITVWSFGNVTLGTTGTMTGLRLRAANNVAGRTATVDCGDRTVNELFLIADNSTAVINLVSNAVAAAFYIYGNGTVNLNNYNLTGSTTSATFTIQAGYSGTYNLGTGTITAGTVTYNSSGTSVVNSSSTNFVLNSATTSNIYLYGKTVGTVVWSSGSQLNWRTTGTIGSLTVTNSSSSARTLSLWANATITGTFTGSNSGSSTLTVSSDTAGTQRTLSAGSVLLTGVSFKDIAASGSAIPFSGSSLTDSGNNTNISFSTATTIATNTLFFGSNF